MRDSAEHFYEVVADNAVSPDTAWQLDGLCVARTGFAGAALSW